jgi:hypothetical protein
MRWIGGSESYDAPVATTGSGHGAVIVVVMTLIATAVAACSTGSVTRPTAARPTAVVSTLASMSSASTPSPRMLVPGLPAAHIHAVGVNFGGFLYLATHLGLFRVDRNGAQRVGPVLDLMSFTVAGPDHFYASGHPGAGSKLTDPLGLIESTDGGKTWKQRSLAGESDFHALSSSGRIMFGFDGTLKSSVDAGTTWQQQAGAGSVLSVATAPGGDPTIVARTAGIIRLTGPGSTPRAVVGAPKLELVSWAALFNVVGTTSDGTVYASTDAGLTWQRKGTVGGPVQAMVSFADGEGNLEVLAATSTALLQSFDTGGHFAPYATTA